jgi:hypothetical protein
VTLHPTLKQITEFHLNKFMKLNSLNKWNKKKTS